MKSSWIGIGFSHHNVPSLSNTATRSSTGTAADPSAPQTRATNATIACLAAPSRQPVNPPTTPTAPLPVVVMNPPLSREPVQMIVRPPSTMSMCPATMSDASEAR